MRFKVVVSETAYGKQHQFEGPGLSKYANGVHFIQPPNEWALECMVKELKDNSYGDRDAEIMLGLLQQAFNAGRQDAKREIRDALGVHKHWGSRDEG